MFLDYHTRQTIEPGQSVCFFDKNQRREAARSFNVQPEPSPLSKFIDRVDQQLQAPTKWVAVFLNLFPGTFGRRLQSLLWYLFLRLSIGRHC
jgi:hypothetical protein